MEIKKTEHCLLCENQQQNFKTGVYCGITKQKPKFDSHCDIIKFGKILEGRILELNMKVALIKKTKANTVSNLIVHSFLGFGVAFLGVFLFNRYGLDLLKLTYGSVYVIGVSSVLLIIGVRLAVNAIAPLNRYLTNYKIAKAKKLRLNQVLKAYNLAYSLDLSIKDEWPDHIEISKKIKMFPIREKGKHVIDK